MLLHTDRGYPTNTLIKKGVVIHDAESPDGATASLVSLLGRPGTNPSTRGGFWGAGYHAVTDGKGGYIQVAPASFGPYAAPPCNPDWWHICMPGYAKQTRDEWLDELSLGHIKGVARFLFEKWNEDGRNWPMKFVPATELAKGAKGYTTHYQVSLAWRQTDHTDPGPNFPWNVLEGEVLRLISNTPVEDDHMYLAYLSGNRVAVVGSSVRPVSTGEAEPGGPYENLPKFTPPAGSYWHDWLSAGYDEYARRMGMA